MTELSFLAITTAFLGGLLSIASPCTLSLIPGYLLFLTAQTATSGLKPGFYFITGFSTFFLALGINAVFLGKLLWHYRTEMSLIAGGLIVLNGIWLLSAPQPRKQSGKCNLRSVPGKRQNRSAFLLGLSFAFGRTPCTGPILGAILTYSASYPHSNGSQLLLGLYALGMVLPFALLAAFYNQLLMINTRFLTALQRLRIYGALVLIALGLTIASGNLVYLSAWLGQIFPTLTKLG